MPGPEEPPSADLDAVLDFWRSEQAHSAAERNGPPVRFVLDFRAPEASDGPSIEALVGGELGLTSIVEPLFEEGEAEARFYLLTFPGATRPDRADLFEVAAHLRRVTGAEVVEPDLGTDYFQCETLDSPPPGSPESADWARWCWAGADDLPNDRDWAFQLLRTADAWAYSRQSGRPSEGAGILVFQPDTGIIDRHVELPDRLYADPRAANFVERGSREALDPARRGNAGHGTGTASVIISSAAGRMRGVAPAASLVPVRCIERVAVFDQSAVARAIDHSRRSGAHVISLSLGGVFSRALHEAVRRAVADNVVLVAAAGNCIGTVVWPARYEEAIAVGGVNARLEAWRGSSSGPAVDFSGPAEFVLRANARSPEDGEESVTGGQGTSFAAALTGGVAALWLAHHGRDRLIGLLPDGRTLQDMFRALVRKTATAAGTLDPDSFGAGVVDARALLEADPARAFAGMESAAPAPAAGEDLESLVADAFGRSGFETVAPALADDQHAQEIACAALDRLRARRTLRAHVEALPPPALSPALRARLAGGVLALRGHGHG
jgi:lambda repressor-like predicted transcriptional regulator